MKTAFEQVSEFHRAFGLPIASTPSLPAPEVQILRRRLEEEEFLELQKAHDERDLIEIADAVADLIYVLLGRCVSYGIPIDQVFDEVHRSNMSKLGENGK